MSVNVMYTCPDCGKETPANPDAPKEKCLNVPRRCPECTDDAINDYLWPDGTYRLVRCNKDNSASLCRARLRTADRVSRSPVSSPINSYLICATLPQIRRFDMPPRMCDGSSDDDGSEVWLIRKDEWLHYRELNAARAAEINEYRRYSSNTLPFDFSNVSLTRIVLENAKPVGHYPVIEYDDTLGACLKKVARVKDVAKAMFFPDLPGTVFESWDTLIELPYISRQHMPPRKSDGCAYYTENEVWSICEDEWDCYVNLNKLLAEEAEASTSDTHSATNSAAEATDTH